MHHTIYRNICLALRWGFGMTFLGFGSYGIIRFGAFQDFGFYGLLKNIY